MNSPEVWKKLHEGNSYFNFHRCYQGNKKYSADGMEIVNTHLAMSKDKSILDLGCGYGRLMKHLVGVSDRVIGLDVAPEPLNEAMKLMETVDAAGKWTLVLGDGERIPLPDDSVDRVICVHVFQHLPRALAAMLMKEIHRVLTPNGIAAVLFETGVITRFDVNLNAIVEQSIQYTSMQIDNIAAMFRSREYFSESIGEGLSSTWLIARKEWYR